MAETITSYDTVGTRLALIRSDTGDGGWSLHTPEQIAHADATDDVAAVLVSGDANWIAETADCYGQWNRPNADDCAEALRLSDT